MLQSSFCSCNYAIYRHSYNDTLIVSNSELPPLARLAPTLPVPTLPAATLPVATLPAATLPAATLQHKAIDYCCVIVVVLSSLIEIIYTFCDRK